MNNFNREKAIGYAEKWALLRNPKYYNYDKIGGNCTNFISQILFEGGMIQDFTKIFGWYYKNANDKAPAWTSVEHLYNYLAKKQLVKEIDINEISPADLVQLSFDGKKFSHTLFVSKIENGNIFVCSNSSDALNRNLNTYFCEKARILKITF